ncbi:MAG: glycerate kinase [Lachnospiraceae bacterium]
MSLTCSRPSATYIYGPQKGVTSKCFRSSMPEWKICKVLTDHRKRQHERTGAGAAAGGLGFAFCYLNGELTPGIQLTPNAVHLEDEMKTLMLS